MPSPNTRGDEVIQCYIMTVLWFFDKMVFNKNIQLVWYLFIRIVKIILIILGTYVQYLYTEDVTI